MSDFDADEPNLPETQLESDGDGSGRPPRKTAVGAPGSGPTPWAIPPEAKKSKPVPYKNIYEMLQVEDGAHFEVLSRAHKFHFQRLDTPFFNPDKRKQQQQDHLNTLWHAWYRSPESQGAITPEEFFAERSLTDLNHYQVFQVLPEANIGIIKAVYEYMERLYHPDNLSHRDEAKYKIINEAWAVLSDPSSRAKYNESLRAETI